MRGLNGINCNHVNALPNVMVYFSVFVFLNSVIIFVNSLGGRGARESDEPKRGRGKLPKLPVAGPRVKHVCRSASLVLGQPVATFTNNTTKGNILYISGTPAHQLP